MSTKPKIGWVGLGVMGSPMVHNLLNAGYEVAVYTRTKSKAETVLDAGAMWIDRISDLAEYADILCTMVGYPEDLEAVVLGEGGALTGMKPGSLLIDFTHRVRNWRKGSLNRHRKGSAFGGCTGEWRRYWSEGRNACDYVRWIR